MKYIDAERLTKAIEDKGLDCSFALKMERLDTLALIDELQQEQPKEICSKCIHHGKDDDYCYNPHGGMQSLINENGVYECTGFYEKEQEQPEVDLEKEIDVFFYGKNFKRCFDGVRVPGMLMRDWQNQNISRSLNTDEIRRFARHFYELGLNAGKP